MRLCCIEGCSEIHYGRGLCRKHYRKEFREGSLPISIKCIIVGCDRFGHDGGKYCRRQQYRFRRYGDPNVVQIERNQNPESICKVINCENKHRARGLCKKHYNFYRWNGLLYQTSPKSTDKIPNCEIEGCNNPYHAKKYCKKHYRKIINPESYGRDDLQLKIAMMNVRKRDGNKCKWYDCEKAARLGDSIHVNHIFPISEYPELMYLEEYMICYCKNHHKEFHEKRGDNCSYFI